jgi:hypothetical protein
MRVKRFLDHSCYSFLKSNYPSTLFWYPILVFLRVLWSV